MVTVNPHFEDHLLARSESVKDFLTLNRTRVVGERTRSQGEGSGASAWSSAKSFDGLDADTGADSTQVGSGKRPSTQPALSGPVFMYSGTSTLFAAVHLWARVSVTDLRGHLHVYHWQPDGFRLTRPLPWVESFSFLVTCRVAG